MYQMYRLYGVLSGSCCESGLSRAQASRPDGERLRLKRPDFYDEALKYCINCKRCEVACPSNVRIGDIIQMARIKYSKKKPKVRDFILANTDLVGTLSTPFAPVVNATLGLKPVKAILDGVMQIDHRRTFPKYAFGTFESWYKKQAEKQARFPQQVSYFHGCYVNYNNPPLGKDLVKVMNAMGVGVQLLKKEKCCGVALISNGFIHQAQKQAAQNISSIRESVIDKQIPVIATSSTCAFTIRDEYPHLLGIQNADVRDHIELATRYIYRLLSQKEIKLNFKKKYKDKSCLSHSLSFGKIRLGLLFYRTFEIDTEYRIDCFGFPSVAVLPEPMVLKKKNYKAVPEYRRIFV